MRTYPLRDEMGHLRGFEVSSLLGRRLARRIAASMPGVSILDSNIREEQFCRFDLYGDLFLIEEPFGDNSRFLVAPAVPGPSARLEQVATHFAQSKAGVWAVRLAALLCFALLAVAAFQPVRRFLAQDACLDAGGRWNYSSQQCEGARRGA